MFLIFAIFVVLLAAGMLFATHFFIYISVANFFPILSHVHQYAIIGILVFFLASFIISSLLAHWKDGFLTRGYYFLSCFWLGFLTNLILASAIAWFLLWLFGTAGLNINISLVGSILYLAAFLYSLYGVWNATHPGVKNLQIHIPNLPDFWRGKKIVQLSDIHLGHNNRAGFMRRIAKKVNSLAPEMVVITGDLFDGMDGDLSRPVAPIKEIQAPSGMYFVTGNHETYLGLDHVYETLKNTPVKILEDEVVNIQGLKIIGVSYPERIHGKSVAKELESLKDEFVGFPNILLYHSPVEINKMAEHGVNLELCGHTHKGQIFPLNLFTRFIYKSYDYGLHKIGDYTLYTTNGAGTWGPTMRTGNVPEIVAITLN